MPHSRRIGELLFAEPCATHARFASQCRFAKTLLDGQASLRLARVCASLRHDWANLERVELAEMPRARDPAAELEHEGHRPRKNEDRVVRERSDLERDRTAINAQPSLGASWELCAIEELARMRLEAIISSLCTIDMSITKVHARQVNLPCCTRVSLDALTLGCPDLRLSR